MANKRCIVSVATGEFYCKLQDRLKDSFYNSIDTLDVHNHQDGFVNKKFTSNSVDLLLWRNVLPKGSSSHEESPYGFKVHAIKYAYEQGYTSILWLDSPCVAVKEDISPIFEKIEKEGYYVMSHIDPLENWVGNTAKTVYNVTEPDLVGYNLPSGSCYGFLINEPEPKNWPLNNKVPLFWDIYFQEQDGMFKSEVISEGKWHRHDEAIIALTLRERNLPVFTFDSLFQSDSKECVIKSGGWL